MCVHLGDHIYICTLVTMHTYFGADAHLKYNYIHIFTEEMILIKYYSNPYHISSKIKENKTSFASWMLEPHPNPITSHFRWDVINQT